MAAVTEVGAIEAYIESDVATESTLVVDVLGTMPQNIALCLSKTEFFGQALVTHQVFWSLLLCFLPHLFTTVKHANEVRLVTLRA